MPRRSDEATIQQIVDAADKIMRRSQSLSYDQFLAIETVYRVATKCSFLCAPGDGMVTGERECKPRLKARP